MEMWRKAKRRAAFKRHLYTYLIINAFLWVLWAFDYRSDETHTFPWPAWTTLGWGIGLVMDYFNAYFGDKTDMTGKEYEKLRKKEENHH